MKERGTDAVVVVAMVTATSEGDCSGGGSRVSNEDEDD